MSSGYINAPKCVCCASNGGGNRGGNKINHYVYFSKVRHYTQEFYTYEHLHLRQLRWKVRSMNYCNSVFSKINDNLTMLTIIFSLYYYLSFVIVLIIISELS